jgi:hypothetical protein
MTFSVKNIVSWSACALGWAFSLGFGFYILVESVEGAQRSLHPAQTGKPMDTNQQTIHQQGRDNHKAIVQNGEHLDLRLEQQGDRNSAELTQDGNHNQATSIQQGNDNTSRIRQQGSGNRATIIQRSKKK